MNIIEFARKRNETFEELPFDYMDALVLSQVAYVRLEASYEGSSTPLRDLYLGEYFEEYFNDGICDNQNMDMLGAVACSRRYRNINITNIESSVNEEKGEQFAVTTFEILNDMEFIGFRGTDGTMVGWKEDCMLSICDSIPAQLSAVDFVNRHYDDQNNKRLIIGGHSKGGNLAAYAAAFSNESIRHRIDKVYCFDSPGFLNAVNEAIGSNFNNSNIVIKKFVPQDSIIGMLLEDDNDYKVIRTNTRNIMQHSIYNWIIEDGNLVYADTLSFPSLFFDRTMQDWFLVATEDERRTFVEALFNALESNNIQEVSDLQKVGIKRIMQIISQFRTYDDETLHAVESMLKSLVKSATKQLRIDSKRK